MSLLRKQAKQDLTTKAMDDQLEKLNLMLKQKESELQLATKSLEHLASGYFTYKFSTNTFAPSTSLLCLFECITSEQAINPELLIDLVLPEDREFMQDLFALPKVGKRKIQGQIKMNTRVKEHKETRVFHVQGYYENPDSDNCILNAVFRDITKENKQLKEIHRNFEKAEDADRIKTNFLLNISHNIRTPMNSILGFSELLSISDPEPERRKDYIQVIKKQSKSLLQLIDDVAEIAKFESGKVEITKSPVNINLLINEIIKDVENLRSSSRKEHVRITFQVPSKEGIEIYTDGGRLHQIFIKLVNSSLKNTTEGSIKLGYSLPSDNRVEFFVEDTSPGIKKDELKSLFDRFALVENKETSEYDDERGLGLSIAKSIVKLLGGRISGESEPDKGLRINFSIPFEQIPDQNPVLDEDELSRKHKWDDKVILIVEDEDVNGLFLEAVFQGTGAQTIFAKNGNQAIELAKSISKIDLILMDIRMPVKNGLKATQEIREFNQKVPIIAQTALAHDEDRRNCLLSGCNDQITKPIDVEELLDLVSRYLSV